MKRYLRSACWLGISMMGCSFGTAGCGSGGSGSSSSTGTLALRLADAPMTDMDHVNVTFSRVEAHISDANGGSWKTIRSTPATIDLKTLVLTDTDLGSANLPAGHYDQLRLIVTKVELVQGTNTFQASVPSGMQTGIKLDVNADVPPNAVTEVLLDFNVARSVHAEPPGSTNYALKPVIPVVLKVLSGTITGKITLADGTTPAANATVAVYTAGSGMVAGTEVNTSATLPDGTFKVWALLAGSYDVMVTYPNPDGTTLTKTFPNVLVTAGQDTTENWSLGP